MKKGILQKGLFLLIFILLPIALFAEEGAQILNYETGLYYTVEKGDTLWDLSKHFYDSPWVWTVLWKENQHIKNPHWIYPGNKVVLYKKVYVESYMPEMNEQTSSVAAKEASSQIFQASKTIPERKDSLLYPMIDRVGFMTTEPVKELGVIVSDRLNKYMISQGDIVYIKSNGNAFNVGNLYYSYKILNPLNDKTNQLGRQYLITGIIEVSKFFEKDGYAEGVVLTSFRPISETDLIMPYVPRSPIIPIEKNNESVKGKILCSEDNNAVYGDGSIVFIDKGTNDSIKKGQIFNIFYEKNLNTDKTLEEIHTNIDYGKLLVIHTEGSYSTALITQSDFDIYAGANFK
ncbi:MAG: LysM peptidoglycan-binding domain-containing protein [Desulfobacterales bacterium]|nr:LysM peptidoglycan-binding domain-containing protein [Desulfobacterales bacterium]